MRLNATRSDPTRIPPRAGEGAQLQIDTDGRMLRHPLPDGDRTRRRRQGDPLTGILPLLCHGTKSDWRAHIEEEVREWWQLMDDRAHQDADPINPQRLFWELNAHLPDDAIISADSGSSANWFARDLKLKPSQMAFLSGNPRENGPGIPYAIAAKFTHPSRPAIALVGDGAMQMNDMAELVTAAKNYSQWQDPRLIVLVLNNRRRSRERAHLRDRTQEVAG